MSVVERAIAEGRDELTDEESRLYAEEQTQKWFGMTVDEFNDRASEGTLPEDDGNVIHVAMLTGADLRSC